MLALVIKSRGLTQIMKTNVVYLANREDSDEVAHNEQPHLNLHCLPSCL